jgi:hypothetical protein
MPMWSETALNWGTLMSMMRITFSHCNTEQEDVSYTLLAESEGPDDFAQKHANR